MKSLEQLARQSLFNRCQRGLLCPIGDRENNQLRLLGGAEIIGAADCFPGASSNMLAAARAPFSSKREPMTISCPAMAQR